MALEEVSEVVGNVALVALVTGGGGFRVLYF